MHPQVFHHRASNTSKYNLENSDKDSRYDTCRNSGSIESTAFHNPISNSTTSSPKPQPNKQLDNIESKESFPQPNKQLDNIESKEISCKQAVLLLVIPRYCLRASATRLRFLPVYYRIHFRTVHHVVSGNITIKADSTISCDCWRCESG
jgi:hypothetical protein